MSTIYLVTGGARSGKSRYAQSLCEYLSPEPIYVATSEIDENDQDFTDRVRRHQKDRGDRWTTIEEPLEPSMYLEKMKGKVVLVDCSTQWLTNYMAQEGLFSLDGTSDTTKGDGEIQDAAEGALRKIEAEFDKLTEPWNCTFVVVANELGSGTHALDHAILGSFNQYVAQKAGAVVHMICGIPHMIKGPQWKPDLSNIVKASDAMALEDAQKADMLDHYLSKREIAMDPNGYFIFGVDKKKKRLTASYHSCIVNDKGEVCDLEGNKLKCNGRSPEPLKTWECRTAKEMTTQLLEGWDMAAKVLSIGHAGYIGREVQKAENALFSGTTYQQD